MSNDTTPLRLWALLIGINQYQSPTINPLQGCLNDVAAMRRFLIDRLAVPDDDRHIRILRDEEATREGILNAIQTFLIDNPAIQPGDRILIHYSGHGSRMRDPTGAEPSGYWETLVPHDSRQPGIFDIPDKTLSALLDRLVTAKGDNVTVILDSCHSGSGTRALAGTGLARTRVIPLDDRVPPLGLDAGLRTTGGGTRAAGPSGWLSSTMPYVLLAACRDQEQANEYRAADSVDQGDWQGALTSFTLDILRQSAAPLSYAELHERLAARVNALYPNQMPQCEGQRQRPLFGSGLIRQDPFITVQRADSDTLTFNAGFIHGLGVGAELDIYPETVRTRDQLPENPLARATVISVAAATAQATFDPPTAVIPGNARCVIRREAPAGIRQTVVLYGEDTAAQPLLERLREAIQTSSYLELQTDPDRSAALRVVAAAGQLDIYNADGERLVEPTDLTGAGKDASAVLHALQTIARYRAVLALRNPDPASSLAGKLRVRLRRYQQDAQGDRDVDLPAGAESEGGDLALSFTPPADQPDNWYVIEVGNEAPLPIYAHIFCLNPDYSITRIYPNHGQQNAIEPGGVLKVGLRSSGDRPLQIFLPDAPARWDACRDHLKVIAITESTDLQWLIQEGLRVPPPQRSARAAGSLLDQLRQAAQAGSLARFGGSASSGPLEDWATVERPFTVVRARQSVPLPATQDRIALGDSLILEKPPGFEGTVTLATWDQATRGVDGDPALRPPPGLAGFPDLFQPLGRPGTRGLGPTGLVLAFEVDEASRRRVGPQTPLRLQLPAEAETTDWLPVAFDGEDYLPVGYGLDAGMIAVVNLPAPRTPGQRGLLRTIRLFLYKKLGRHTPLLGLRYAQRTGEQYDYADLQGIRFQAGDTVALLIHGFNSDTRWMLRGVAPFLRDSVHPYDHILTWDYETFGTAIKDQGVALAQALQQHGFSAQDGRTLHVHAHSMGSLVARSLIEQAGGQAFVDRLVMAGPPNRGTTLATLSRGGVYLLTLLLNQLSDIPPVAAANWTLKQLYEQGLGAADLAVDSDFLKDLNQRREPVGVPYLVLAGENIVDSDQQNRWRRLAHKVLDRGLDTLFGEQNDLVVGLSSLGGVRGGAYAPLTVHTLSCNHFNYYDFPEARAVIREWINKS
jgi:hypothetical protein